MDVRYIPEDACVEWYAAVVEVMSHVLERAVERDTHALEDSRRVH